MHCNALPEIKKRRFSLINTDESLGVAQYLLIFVNYNLNNVYCPAFFDTRES
jgi:hypothetical protein